jgi:hypothetical protein
MKKITLLSLIAVVGAGIFLVSCKAAGSGASKSGKHTYRDGILFSYIPEEGENTEQVFVSGGFNRWRSDNPGYKMKENEDGVFEVMLYIFPGKYVYKYVINGLWVMSMEDIQDRITPKPNKFVGDGFGGNNAFIEVE